MKKMSLILGVLLCLISCSKSENEVSIQKKNIVDKQNGYSEYIVYPNSKLNITSSNDRTIIDIQPGKKLVFKYIFTIDSNPDYFDSGYKEYLLFEMDAHTVDFKLKTEDLADARTYLRRSCYCPFTDSRLATSGIINAEMTGNLEWDIDFELESTIVEDGEIVETIAIQNSGKFKPE